MAVPRLRVPNAAPPSGSPLARSAQQVSDEVQLYHRTYTTLLRSSGETLLRVLEPSHRSMSSSLHALAASETLDLGAFLYAIRRLPDALGDARVVIMGQEVEVFARHGIGPLEDWAPLEAPARRRRWFDDGKGTMAVLLASASDLDDLIPTLVAYQIEWNKLRFRLRAADWPPEGHVPVPAELADVLGGVEDDWIQLAEAWGDAFTRRLAEVAARRLNLRVRMLGGSSVGYARMTRHWWGPVRATLAERALIDRPMYFVSSNPHSLVNLVSGTARRRESEVTDWVESAGEEREVGITHISSRTALRVSAQVIAFDSLNPEWLDPRLGDVDPETLARCPAVVVNIEYPLGLAAYNILREITEAHDTLRGVYVLGKAATLNADVGDVMISSVIHDEHSGSTYWLDNAFSVSDIAPYLVFGSGLDNQRAVTVKSTFLQNREYLDFYYREAFTVVEMEAGPYCNAVYEIADVDRYPVGEAVNFAKLPIDFGIIHYASDTPYTQARTLGARGLSYYGMDSTYASSLAILRRVLRLEDVLD